MNRACAVYACSSNRRFKPCGYTSRANAVGSVVSAVGNASNTENLRESASMQTSSAHTIETKQHAEGEQAWANTKHTQRSPCIQQARH
jgi:hypothetical protein